MPRRVRFFRQHTPETCGVSCMLMALDYYHRVQYPTLKQELKLYSRYRCRAFKGVLAAAAADCLSKNRLRVKLYHTSSLLMENRDDYFPPVLYQAMLEEYRNTLVRAGSRIDVEAGWQLMPDWLRRQLDADRLVMLQCVVPGDADDMHDRVLHWVLVCRHGDGMFQVCDPWSRKIWLTESELMGYADTPIGGIALTISDNSENQTQEEGDCRGRAE